MLELPTTPEKIITFMEELGISYDLHHHEAVFTTKESKHLYETIDGGHCRNLFLKDKKGRMALVTAVDQTEIDLKALANHLELGRFSFCSAERLWDKLGVQPGSVTPLALYNNAERDVRAVLDARMFDHKVICVHPLINTQTICFSPKDLERFLEKLGYSPIIVDMDKIVNDL